MSLRGGSLSKTKPYDFWLPTLSAGVVLLIASIMSAGRSVTLLMYGSQCDGAFNVAEQTEIIPARRFARGELPTKNVTHRWEIYCIVDNLEFRFEPFIGPFLSPLQTGKQVRVAYFASDTSSARAMIFSDLWGPATLMVGPGLLLGGFGAVRARRKWVAARRNLKRFLSP